MKPKSIGFASLPEVTREEILALMDELGLVPSVVLTPTLIKMIQDEFRAEIARVNTLAEDIADRKYFLTYYGNRRRKRRATIASEDAIFIGPEFELFNRE